MIIEKCPICGNKLEIITDEDGFVIDWWCGKCPHSWTLEDLEITEDQKTIDQYL